ncbi:hypothetical protein IU11_18825 [Cellulosimicrobium sp. MM]|nr:hypothetical protein IU11_18825 [Cellulosimicrobium sp. MM]
MSSVAHGHGRSGTHGRWRGRTARWTTAAALVPVLALPLAACTPDRPEASDARTRSPTPSRPAT